MVATLRIKEIVFKAKSSLSSSDSTIIKPGNVTIFVGPNGSGKSTALREILKLSTGIPVKNMQSISSLDIDSSVDAFEIRELLKDFEVSLPPDYAGDPSSKRYNNFQLGDDPSFQIQGAVIIDDKLVQKMVTEDGLRRRLLIRFFVTHTLGRMRLTLCEPKGTGDPTLPPNNLLKSLAQNSGARKKIRQKTKEICGKFFVIDPTALNLFSVKMSEQEPKNDEEEVVYDSKETRAFHKAAISISEFSDGIRAFIGLFSVLLSAPYKIILIDEPEAFLHPPLARKLGEDITDIAKDRDASVFLATHSADLVMGCLTKDPKTTIVRFTLDKKEGEQQIATVRSISGEDVEKIMKTPLLRTSGVLRGLFHNSVIVTEGASDRAFYDEINRRIQEDDVNKGIKDTMFIPSYNCGSEIQIIRSLRKLGIPTAGIFDFDFIRNKNEWKNIFDSINFSDTEKEELNALLDKCAKHYESVPLINKEILKCEKLAAKDNSKLNELLAKCVGINVAKNTENETLNPKYCGTRTFSGQALVDINLFIEKMSKKGLFIVPVGEMEQWLSCCKINVRKDKWLEKIFDEMVNTSIKPSNNDVWKFVNDIGEWTNNSNREGMPQ